MATTLTLLDGTGSPFPLAAESNAGVLTLHSVPEIAGTAVTAANPLPVAAAQSGTWGVTLNGVPTVTAGQGGNWSFSLAGSLPAGSNSIGAVSVQNWPASQAVSGSVVSTPAGGTIQDRSLTTTAGASTTLLAANTLRRFFRVQAPQSAALWFNPTGGTCAPNAAGCFYLPAAAIYESGSFVSTNAVTCWCATASLVVAASEG
jgi:hypothetical protein